MKNCFNYLLAFAIFFSLSLASAAYTVDFIVDGQVVSSVIGNGNPFSSEWAPTSPGTYNVQAKVTNESGSFAFSNISTITVSAASQFHPADLDSDSRFEADEVTNYASCWLTSCNWQGTGQINIDFVSAAASIYLHGEIYSYNSSIYPPWQEG